MAKIHHCDLAEFKKEYLHVKATCDGKLHPVMYSIPWWQHVTCKRCLKKRPSAEVAHDEEKEVI